MSPPPPPSTRLLADYSGLPTTALGGPHGLRFRFYQGGHLQSLRHGPDLLVNLTLGCPLAGAMHRLDLEVTGPDGIRVLTVIGAGSEAAFSITPTHAFWQLSAAGLDITATLGLDSSNSCWCLRLAVANTAAAAISWRALHGIDVGLTTQGAARNNEAYTSQYIDHCPLAHPRCGTVLASRQNLPVSGNNPFLLQACIDGCDAYATDARDVFGPAIRRPGPPLCLGPDPTPLPGLRQAESSYVALLSRPFETAPGAAGECRFVGVFLADHPAPSSAADLSLLDKLPGLSERITGILPVMEDSASRLSANESTGWKPVFQDRQDACPPAKPPESAAAPATAATSARSLFHAPAVVHGADLTEIELRALIPGAWDLVERSSEGVLWSFFSGEDSRHLVTRAKECVGTRPHGNILRSGGGDFPDPSQLSTTTFMAGIFNALLSSGHPSFHRLLSFPRESCGLFATTGQRIWIHTGEHWELLGVPSVFEMALANSRWIYRLPNHTLEISVSVDPGRSRARLELRVTAGPAARFLVTHGLIAGINEYDATAELEIDAAANIVRIRAAADGLFRKADAGAHFTLRATDPSTIESITGAEGLAGGDASHAMLIMQTREVPGFGIEIEGHTTLAGTDTTADTAPHWQDDALALRLRAGDPTIGRIQQVLPWFVHNGMIHLTVPHGLEQYNGGAWGSRDVTQGSIEMLLALGRFASCRKILLLTYQHQFLGEHHWPQWFMTDPFGWIQQAHCHGDIPLWPLKALCDYLEATADFAILDAAVAWTQPGSAVTTAETSPLLEHVVANIAWLRANCIPGTALLRYGDGDWNDSLQPAKPEFRERLVSSWSVALCYQVLRRLEELSGHCGREFAGLAGFADALEKDFRHQLVIDGTLCGFFLFDAGSSTHGQPLLHPQDQLTGIHYRLLPMTRSMLGGLFTPAEATRHEQLIRQHLLAADGARLMDRPPAYRGGVCEIFQRAELSSCFSREIGIFYTHAHLRYIEAMARLGHAEQMLDGFGRVTPADLTSSVRHALPRQANAYFSSSDAAVSSRYEAAERYAEIKAGAIGVDGGWRIYSSGPGIYVNLVLTRMLGLRRHYEHVVLDPVLPISLDGLEAEMPWDGHRLQLRFSVKHATHTPRAATLNGTPLHPLGLSPNPYRSGGWLLDASAFRKLLHPGINLLEVEL